MKTDYITIPPEALGILDYIQGQGYIAGGYARWCVTGQPPIPSDIDIFHYKQNMFYEAVDTDEFQLDDPVVSHLEELGYRIYRDLPNAIEMKMSALFEVTKEEFNAIVNGKMKHSISRSSTTSYFKYVPVFGYSTVQVIKPFANYVPPFNDWRGVNPTEIKCTSYNERLAMKTFGRPDEVMAQFDFPQAMAALEYCDMKDIGREGHMGVVRATYNDALNSPNLTINHINCPIAVSMRVAKYCGKGFTIRPREIIKLFKDWDMRPPEYKRRLIELCDKDELEANEWFELEKLLRID